MAFEATWINGAIIPDEPLPLPDGTRLEVVPVPEEKSSLAQRMGWMVGLFDDLPADLAEEHNHYVHGTPKRNVGGPS
jgi:hypothetical protein